MKPSSVTTIQFQLNMSFKNALDSEGAFLIMYMPMGIQGDRPATSEDEEAQNELDFLTRKAPNKSAPRRMTVPKKSRSSQRLGSGSPHDDSHTALSDDDEQHETQIHGALIYEEPVTGELILNFYTSSLESFKNERLDYPQAPL